MRGSSARQNDQTRWIGFLIRSANEAELPTLRDRVKTGGMADAAPFDAPFDAPSGAPSTSGRLLALYIARARERQGSDCQRARTAAKVELDDIQNRIEGRIEGRLNGRADATPCAQENVAQTAIQIPDADPIPHPEPVAAPATGDPGDPGLAEAIRLTYRMVLKRGAVEAEVQIWLQNFQTGVAFHDFLLMIHAGDEALALRDGEAAGEKTCAGASDGDFIVDLFRVIRGRGCSAHEVDLLRARLEAGAITRAGLLTEAFTEIAARERNGADEVPHDGLSAAIMGTGTVVTLADWQNKARDADALARAREDLEPATPFVWPAEPGIRVSAIASLYCGGDFIEQFMDNITSQTGFDRYCELIIIDAESPENEGETIARYLDRHPSIVYRRMNSRVGIYEAWNIGVEIARGRYLSNTNLDDHRRQDSLEIQAGALDAMPFADVVYQDFYTTFDPALSWEEVAAFGYKSDLPVITLHNMLQFNSPHSAPMWRKSLHDELGLFDASFKSAGDYEFWMRCLSAGKMFYKVNEPHVIYYQNPRGLSTRADTRGLVEAHAITRKYGAGLIPPAMTCEYEVFLKDVGVPEYSTGTRNRYLAAQTGLRNLARRFKGGEQ